MITLTNILNETTGIEGKIRRLIIDKRFSSKVVYSLQKADRNFRNWQHKFHGNYSKTYIKKTRIAFLYTRESLIKWFEQNRTIKFKGKDVEINTDMYIERIKAKDDFQEQTDVTYEYSKPIYKEKK